MPPTIVTQTPPPLQLRTRPRPTDAPSVDPSSVTRVIPSERPPSYPMMPFDMGVDLYEPTPHPGDTATGLIRRAPYQYGNWVLQPAYARALPVVIDTKENFLWTRSLSPAMHQWYPEKVLRSLSRYKMPEDIRWLQCLRISPTNNLLEYSIIIVDYMHPTYIHAARRAELETVFPQLGVRSMPKPGEVYLVPEFPDSVSEDLWAGLHIMNTSWKDDFFRGIMTKHATAPYYMQKDDFSKPSVRWHFHRFAQPRIESNEA